MRQAWLVLVGLAAAGTVAAPAYAQMDSREGIALQNQILELRRDLQALQGQRGVPPPAMVRGSGGANNEIAAQLLDRVQTLEDEVRRLRGQLDEQGNAQRRRLEEVAKRQAEADFARQNPVAPTAPSVPGPGPTRLDPPPSQGGTGRRPPEMAMQEGNAALARRDYPAAEAASREVLAGGRTPRTIDAQFLLAQSLYGRRDYAGAAVAFDDSYSAARTGSRAPDALVGLANSLSGLNDSKSACMALDRLRAEFPSPRGDVRIAAQAARTRAACR